MGYTRNKIGPWIYLHTEHSMKQNYQVWNFLEVKPETTLGKSVLNIYSYKQYFPQYIKESNDKIGFQESIQFFKKNDINC